MKRSATRSRVLVWVVFTLLIAAGVAGSLLFSPSSSRWQIPLGIAVLIAAAAVWRRRGGLGGQLDIAVSDRASGEQPPEIVELIAFLKQQGLTLLRKLGPDRAAFGNVLLEYGNAEIGVHIVLDRSHWEIGIVDPAQPSDWWDPGLIRQLVLGVGSDRVPLPEEVRIVETLWPRIVAAFSPSCRQSSHARLEQLGQERARRIFPAWSDAALDLEKFLRASGLTCQRREAPQGSFGHRHMQYADATLVVRVTNAGPEAPVGWNVEVADATQPDRWYYISLVHCLIERTTDRQMPYARAFEFVQEKWAEIRQLFAAEQRAATHAELARLSDVGV